MSDIWAVIVGIVTGASLIGSMVLFALYLKIMSNVNKMFDEECEKFWLEYNEGRDGER